MKAVRAAGFTLIELLTVIAIISILAGLTAVVLPGALERAKVTDVTGDLKAISTSLHGYYTEHGTYPPGYGYQLFEDFNGQPTYNHHPYTVEAGIVDALDSYDRFSEDYDTNDDGILSRLEFIPLPGDRMLPPPNDSWLSRGITETPYQGGEAVNAFVKRTNTKRPYVYVPYYKADLKRMHRILGEEWMGDTWDPAIVNNNTLFPPPQYDGFVLMSVGPLRNTRGLVTPVNEDGWLTATGQALPERAYYLLGMRAAYLATRDANDDGKLDFDYRARTREGQGKIYPNMPDAKPNLGYASPIIWSD